MLLAFVAETARKCSSSSQSANSHCATSGVARKQRQTTLTACSSQQRPPQTLAQQQRKRIRLVNDKARVYNSTKVPVSHMNGISLVQIWAKVRSVGAMHIYHRRSCVHRMLYHTIAIDDLFTVRLCPTVTVSSCCGQCMYCAKSSCVR